jgi:prefoldin subunit 5
MSEQEALELIGKVKETVEPLKARLRFLQEQINELTKEAQILSEEISENQNVDFLQAKKLIGQLAIQRGGKSIKIERRSR